MTKTCEGCGSKLQTKDPSKVGYTPKENAKLCERCFKLKNYNQKVVVELKYNNDEIIGIINEKADAIFFVTDFLNLSKRIIDTFNRLKKKKYLIINKSDYIPKSINKEKYINWVKDTYKVDSEIILLSAEKGYNINHLNNLISSYKNSYICGYTNSGKSTIISALLELNGKKNSIISSLMPNTTLDVIKVNLSEKIWAYDTPGFICESTFDDNSYPKKFIKPITIQLKINEVVKLNDMIYIKNLGENNSFTFYVSDKLTVKKEFKKEIIFTKQIEVTDNCDLVINSYGFVNIKKSCDILITDFDYEVRESMF